MGRFAEGWLSERDIHPNARMRLFCLPHAGSGAAAFYRWKRDLAGVDVCPVLLPGREARMAESARGDALELVDALSAAIAPLLDVPFAIFGHSMGALLAYEWALRTRERSPVCLFVSGRDAPHRPPAHRALHRLDDDALVAELALRYGGSSGQLLADEELREIFLPILRADLRVVETYRPSSAELLECPIVAFAGREDASVSPSGLASWGELTRGVCSVRRVAGDHFCHLGDGQTEMLQAIDEGLGGLTPLPIPRS
jgi:medium-chain acyl-[acyl-carrier-protein] hydrolase